MADEKLEGLWGHFWVQKSESKLLDWIPRYCAAKLSTLSHLRLGAPPIGPFPYM